MRRGEEELKRPTLCVRRDVALVCLAKGSHERSLARKSLITVHRALKDISGIALIITTVGGIRYNEAQGYIPRNIEPRDKAVLIVHRSAVNGKPVESSDRGAIFANKPTIQSSLTCLNNDDELCPRT